MNAFQRRYSFAAVALALALAAAPGRAASDCFTPLLERAGWRCRADVAGGQVVDYCLERTNVFGTDPAERFFKLIATGPYASFCSCNAKGKPPAGAFGQDKTFLCLYPDTDAVVSGKIAKRKITGQTFSAAYNLRTLFHCKPDPLCDVPAVVDPDLTPENGDLDLLPGESQNLATVAAGGGVALGYLPGCAGYAREAPAFVFRVSTAPSEIVRFRFTRAPDETDYAGILVVTPSGASHCHEHTVELPSGGGAYAVWLRSTAPGAALEGNIDAYHGIQ